MILTKGVLTSGKDCVWICKHNTQQQSSETPGASAMCQVHIGQCGEEAKKHYSASSVGWIFKSDLNRVFSKDDQGQVEAFQMLGIFITPPHSMLEKLGRSFESVCEKELKPVYVEQLLNESPKCWFVCVERYYGGIDSQEKIMLMRKMGECLERGAELDSYTRQMTPPTRSKALHLCKREESPPANAPMRNQE